MASNGDDFDSVKRLTETAGEFRRIDDRFAGRRYRYGWMPEMDPARPVNLKGGSAAGQVMNCLFLKDRETGADGSCRSATGWRSIAATS